MNRGSQCTAMLFKMLGLHRIPLLETLRAMSDHADVQVEDFSPEHGAAFKRMNVEWITQHWQLETADLQALNHPQEYILDKGGAILIALFDGHPVGSVALIPYDEATLELGKMAVAPNAQGLGIGKVLGEAALARARKMGARRVYLETNSILGPALSLYRKLGFSDVAHADRVSAYDRCNVRMEVWLDA